MRRCRGLGRCDLFIYVKTENKRKERDPEKIQGELERKSVEKEEKTGTWKRFRGC